MRNLRKYFAVFVAVALLVTAIAPAFAADTAPAATTSAPAALTDAKIVETVGMLVGDGSGVTDAYLASTPSKLQSAIMFLRLKGLEKEATAFKGTENFKDADKVDWDAGVAILAYLKSKPDLGFVGNPDGTFDPNAAVTAQQYYKILLVGLGYVEGKDFKYDDTLKFAETKGLKKAAGSTKFTINDVAIATVEALKATTADGKKTLVQSLIDAKVLDAVKAANATLIAGSGPATSFDLTAKTAKTLYAKLNGVVADTAKVTIDVTRDAGIKATLTATWDKDKAGVVLSTDTNLVAGDYTVAIKDDTKDLGKKVVKIEQEKIAKIEMTSKSITRRSDSEGVAYYKVTNQYGDDVSKAPIASNITWNSSLGTNRNNGVTADKGVLTLVKNDNPTDNDFSVYMGLLKDQKSVVVTAYDSDSNVTMNETMTVSDTVGDIQSLKFLGISNKDGKTKIEKQGTDTFYLDYEAKDSNGNLVTDYKIFSNTSAFKLTPGAENQSTIAWAEVVTDPNDNKQAKFQIKTLQTDNAIAGTQIISGISIATGKSANFQVDVVEGSVLQQFILQKPAQDVAIGDGFVEVPFLALDSNGNPLTEYSKINTNKLSLSGVDSGNVKRLQNPDGTFKLLVDFGTAKTSYTVSATVNTTTTVKMSNITVNVKEAAYPKSIISLDDKKFVPGVVYGGKTGDKMDKVKILDQYDRAINLRHYSNKFKVSENNDINEYYFYVRATLSPSEVDKFSFTSAYGGAAGDSAPVATYKRIAYGNDTKIELYANAINGSVNATFELVKSTKQANDVPSASSVAATDPSYNKVAVVDSKNFTFYNVNKKDIQSYYIDELKPNLYANQANTKLNDTGYAPVTSNATYDGATRKDVLADPAAIPPVAAGYAFDATTMRTKDTWFGEGFSDAKIRGKYNGMRVALVDADTSFQVSSSAYPNIYGDIVSYSVSDTAKFGTFFKKGSLNTDYKVWAKYVDTDPYTGVISVAVKGYQGVITTAKADINSKADKAIAASISVDFEDAFKTSIDGGTNIYVRPVVSLGSTGDVFKVSEAFATKYFAGPDAAHPLRIYQFSYADEGGLYRSIQGHKYYENLKQIVDHTAVGTFTLKDPADPTSARTYDWNYDDYKNFPVRSSIFFYVTDQYGKKGVAPTTLSVANNAPSGATLVADSTLGTVYFTGTPKNGDSFTITAVSGNGVSKAITVYIDNVDYAHSYK